MDLKAAVDGFRAETGPAEQVSFAGPDIAIVLWLALISWGPLFLLLEKFYVHIVYKKNIWYD